jgi:hypothetical protein
MKSPFDDYDEFACDVIDAARRFLVRRKVFTRAEVDALSPARLWKECVKRGWKAPDKQ